MLLSNLRLSTLYNLTLKNIMKKLIIYCCCYLLLHTTFAQEISEKYQQKIDSTQKVMDKLITQKGYQDSVYLPTLRHLVVLYQQAGAESEAESNLYELLDKYTARGSNMKAQRTLPYLAIKIILSDLYVQTERYSEAAEVYHESIELSNLLLSPSHDLYLYQMKQLVAMYQKIGLYADREKNLLEIEKIYVQHQLTQRIDYASMIEAKAQLLTEAKLYIESIDMLENTLAQLNKSYFKPYKAINALEIEKQMNVLLAQNYLALQQADKAEKLLKGFLVKANKTVNINDIYVYLGLAQQQQRNYEAALQTFENSKNYSAKKYGSQSIEYCYALVYMADVYAAKNQLSTAEGLYKQALQIMSPQKENKAVEYAKILYQFGKLYEKSYLYQNAIPLFEECMKLRNAELGEEHPDYLAAINHLATVYQHLQLYDKAEPHFKEYIHALNKDILRKFPSLSDQQKAVFYDAIKPNIENFMRYAINRVGLNPYVKVPAYKHSPAILGDLYDLQLATKAILLNAGSNTRQKILSSQDTALVRKYKRWVAYKEKLAQIAMIKRQDIGKLGVNVDSLQQSANSLEKELTLLSTDFAGGYASSQLPTWKDIRAKLQAQEAAVEIIQIPYKQDTTFYVALIIKADTKDYPEVAFWANGNDLNKKFLKTYRNAVLYQSFEKGSYLTYWKPIADKLKGIQKVYVSPDGAYHQISLLTLWNDEAQRFLLDEIQIALLTNTKDILLPTTKGANKPTAVLIGRPSYSLVTPSETERLVKNTTRGTMREVMRGAKFSDLLGTEKEVYLIDSLLQQNKWATHKYMGKNAHELVIKRMDSLLLDHRQESPTILHIATHGFFVNANEELSDPMLRSGIVLAGINNFLQNGEKLHNEDGILNAYETMLLNLSGTDLVVLSACETGLGDIKQGEGVYGLQRALRLAGAKSVMMSLWKVDDRATMLLMAKFYQELMQGKTKAEAFLAAQKSIKEMYPQPRYWGAFVLVGGE